jgi:CBS domain-containing protein
VSATSDPTQHGSYLMPSLAHATVADAMHPGIMTCDPDTPLTQVARMMAGNHIHCIAVMGISHVHGESLVWGIISDLDLIRAGIADGAEETAATMAKSPIVSVSPATPLREAAEMMLGQGAPHVLVVDPAVQRPLGMLSSLDVAGILAWGEA